MNRSARAAVYRRLAQEYEAKDGACVYPTMPQFVEEYTCNAVKKALGVDEGETYQDTFDIHHTQYRLWEHGIEGRTKLRILMLCFMAAMVEAGDA